ncbi:MAG TPA: hypothetical protein PKY59_17045 [Pyrinomonadaceae bacterium]|nr:hypothetical protein [Pyrinomonadaceae bacterium]
MCIKSSVLMLMIFSFAMFGFSQESGNQLKPQLSKKDQKKLDKENTKLQKQKQKAEKEKRDESLRQIEVDIDEVAKFPQSFTERKLRTKFLFFGELEAQADGDKTVYFADVRSRTGATQLYSFPSPNKLAFVVSEETARAMYVYYKTQEGIFRDYFPGHAIYEIKKIIAPNESVYYFATVYCIEFTSITGAKNAIVGSCPSI